MRKNVRFDTENVVTREHHEEQNEEEEEHEITITRKMTSLVNIVSKEDPRWYPWISLDIRLHMCAESQHWGILKRKFLVYIL